MTSPRDPLADRVALVTGATRGLGLETSRQLAEAGLRVVMTGRDAKALDRARQTLGARPDRAMAVPMDVTVPDSLVAARDAIDQAWHRQVDVVVNNAAILLFEDEDVLSIPGEAFAKSMTTNVLGAIDVCRVFVPGMVERGYGRVVNVSSGAGQVSRSSTYAPAYSISKVALNAFTRILAETHRGSGVLVNAVDPGWVRTDMGGPAAPRSVSEGADTIVWLATLPRDGATGGFFRDRHPIAW